MTASHWRRHARAVILPILTEAVAAKLDAKAARKLCNASYPFGTRERHPYKVWLAELKAQLKAHGFVRGQKKEESPAGVFFAFARNFRRPLWLHVRCGWCGDKMAGGCMVCVGHHRRAAEAAADPEFVGLRADAERDAALEGVLGDWCEEHLGGRCGLPGGAG